MDAIRRHVNRQQMTNVLWPFFLKIVATTFAELVKINNKKWHLRCLHRTYRGCMVAFASCLIISSEIIEKKYLMCNEVNEEISFS
jgi:hypothetical protein